jgi:hypothetical protein
LKGASWKYGTQSLHCILAVLSCCGKDLGIITECGGLAIHFRGEAHSFVCFAGMVEEIGAEKCSEKSLSFAADDVLGNYWWYAFNTNVCFRDYVNVAILTFVHKTRGQTGG